MIEKQPTSLTPPPQSDELISSVVGSILKRQELIDINPDKIESNYGRPYAYKIRQLQQEENQRLRVAARERSRLKERRPISLKRRLAQGALALSLVAGVTPFVVNVFHHDDQSATTYDSDTELTSKDEPVVNEYINPPSDLSRYDPRPPESEYINPPSDISPKYPQNPPGYENENPSKNDESDGVVVPDVPPMNPEPNDYDNPPSEPNW